MITSYNENDIIILMRSQADYFGFECVWIETLW
jgi:hypothetical protein